jgi:hypothetical protein
MYIPPVAETKWFFLLVSKLRKLGLLITERNLEIRLALVRTEYGDFVIETELCSFLGRYDATLHYSHF